MAGIVAIDGIEGLVAATIIAGVLLMLMGLFEAGDHHPLRSHTITTGFTAGIAVTLVIGQMKDFLGLTFSAGASTVETMDKLSATALSITTVNWQACAVGVVCLAILFLWPRLDRLSSHAAMTALARIPVPSCRLSWAWRWCAGWV